jgi:hypothetical protein
MAPRIATLAEEDRSRAVASFDAKFGEMEQALWCLACNCRKPLLAGQADDVVDALVWTVKSWWAVQGIRGAWRPIFSEVLASMQWTEEMFGPDTGTPGQSETFAVTRVEEFVSRSMELGVTRREYSLGSKILHWLHPWRVPVYDKLVRDELGIVKSWDHPRAYRRLVADVFAEAEALRGADPAWIGSTGSRAPLRGIDKCLWWIGGGEQQKAFIVSDPFYVVRKLGIDPSSSA